MNVSEVIRTKRAVRQFRPDPLPQEVIEHILNAGRRAQSSKNTQPWQFIAITDRQTLQALSTLGSYGSHVGGAALGVASLGADPASRFSVLFDAGQAAAYMQLAAWEKGVGSVPATIYQPEQARQLLGFPPEWHLNVAFSFGYPADPEAITRPPKKGGRVGLDQVVHWNRW